MILDNENNNLKVHEWISKYTEEGKLRYCNRLFHYWRISLSFR